MSKRLGKWNRENQWEILIQELFPGVITIEWRRKRKKELLHDDARDHVFAIDLYLLINMCLFSLPLYLKFHFIIHPLYHRQELSFLVVGASTPHGTNHHHLCPLHSTSRSGGTHSGQPRLTDKLECKASRPLAVARKIEINLKSPRTSQNRFRDTDLGYD